MNQGPLVEIGATGAQIGMMITKINRALSGHDPAHIVISCLANALILQKPHISSYDIQEGVRVVSGCICNFLSETETEEGEKLVLQ